MKSLIIAVCAAGAIALWSETLPASGFSGGNATPHTLTTLVK